MTQRDIRDIAAYYGASVSLTFTDGYTLYTRVDSHFLSRVQDPYKEIKLQLRPIVSLTDKEVNATYCAIIGKEFAYSDDDEPYLKEVFRNGREHIIDFYWPWGIKGQFVGGGIRITFDGVIYHETTGNGGESIDNYCDNAQAGYVYLQSIGVYVPGTISEEYVNLVT